MHEQGSLIVLLLILIVSQGLMAGCKTMMSTPTDIFSTATPDETIDQPVLIWERSLTESCQTMTITAQGQASYGPCSNPDGMARILSAVERLDDLRYFLDQYQPFEADTPAGRISFAGQGIQVATASERQAIAEWATLVHQELQYGRSGASWGLAVGLIEEGSNPCSRIQIEVYGKTFVNNCSVGIEPYPTEWLTKEEIDQLYTWMNEFQTTEMNWDEDGLPMRLVFSGRGSQDATEADQQEILTWVSELYESVTR